MNIHHHDKTQSFIIGSNHVNTDTTYEHELTLAKEALPPQAVDAPWALSVLSEPTATAVVSCTQKQ